MNTAVMFSSESEKWDTPADLVMTVHPTPDYFRCFKEI